MNGSNYFSRHRTGLQVYKSGSLVVGKIQEIIKAKVDDKARPHQYYIDNLISSVPGGEVLRQNRDFGLSLDTKKTTVIKTFAFMK